MKKPRTNWNWQIKHLTKKHLVFKGKKLTIKGLWINNKNLWNYTIVLKKSKKSLRGLSMRPPQLILIFNSLPRIFK